MNCPEYLDVYGAGEVAGYIIAPVNFRLAPPEIRYILTSAAPKVLVFEQQYSAVIEQLRAQLAWRTGIHLYRRSGAGVGAGIRSGARFGRGGRSADGAATRATSHR